MSEQGPVVRARTSLIGCVVLLTGAAAIAQTGASATDPVTGKWGHDGLTYLDLKFDGQSGVSGTTIWRHGSGYEHHAAIKTGSFDAKTGTLRLEGEAKGPDGVAVVYVIEGRIEEDTVPGTFKFGDDEGEFTFTRL